MYDISHFDQQEYEWNNVDNPNFPFLSNIVNFEFRFLSDYMKKYENLNPAEAKEFYVNYLKQKSQYSLMRVKEYSPVLENIHDSKEQDFLQKDLEYEQATANVLKKPDENVIEIEKLKMDLKAMLFEKLFKEGGSKQSYTVIHRTYKKLLDAVKAAYINNPDDKNMQLYAECQYKIYTNNYWRQF